MKQSFFSTILGILYPVTCIGCAAQGQALCNNCITTVPLSADLTNQKDYAVFDYSNKIVRDTIWQFKYKHNASAMKILVRHSAPYIIDFIAQKLQNTSAQSLVFIPIAQHKKKTHSRGYNQSLLIAKWLAKEIPQTQVKELLYKNIPTLPQARTTHKTARLKNVHTTMIATRILDKNQVYIIVDDVTTTGATLNEARRALIQNGAKKIFSVVISHGRLVS